MMGDTSFIEIVRQVFQLTMIKEINYTFEDYENMTPFIREAYFDLVDEYREEQKKLKKEMEEAEKNSHSINNM